MKKKQKFEASKDKGSSQEMGDFEKGNLYELLDRYEEKIEEKGLASMTEAVYSVYESLENDFYEKQKSQGKSTSILNPGVIYDLEEYFINDTDAREIKADLLDQEAVSLASDDARELLDRFVDAKSGDEGWFHYLVRDQAINFAEEKGFVSNKEDREILENFYAPRKHSKLKVYLVGHPIKSLKALEKIKGGDEETKEAMLLCNIYFQLANTAAAPPWLDFPFELEDVQKLHEWMRRENKSTGFLYRALDNYESCCNKLYNNKGERGASSSLKIIEEFPTEVDVLDERLEKIENQDPRSYSESLKSDFTHSMGMGSFEEIKKDTEFWDIDIGELESDIADAFDD